MCSPHSLHVRQGIELRLPLTLKQLLILIFLLFSLCGIASACDPNDDGVDELPFSTCASVSIRAEVIAMEEERVTTSTPSHAPPTEDSSFIPLPAATIPFERPTSDLPPRAPPA